MWIHSPPTRRYISTPTWLLLVTLSVLKSHFKWYIVALAYGIWNDLKIFLVYLMGNFQSLVVYGIEKICLKLGSYIVDFNCIWILSLTSINYIWYIYKDTIIHAYICAYKDTFKNVHFKQNLLVLEIIRFPRLQITKYLFLPNSGWWFFKVHLPPKILLIILLFYH